LTKYLDTDKILEETDKIILKETDKILEDTDKILKDTDNYLKVLATTEVIVQVVPCYCQNARRY
jgi:hypothetical protein